MVAIKNARITARVPEALRKKLESLAADSHRKLADFVCLALTEYVSAKEKPRKGRRAA